MHPSTTPGKKIDVYAGKKLASIGDTAYSDYPTYLQDKGKAFADERRRLYHIRHKKDEQKKGTPGVLCFASSVVVNQTIIQRYPSL